jgi:hypothetical protein
LGRGAARAYSADDLSEGENAMIAKPWRPDVEVAVHDQDLVVTLDNLPEMHLFEAEIEDGEVLVLTENLLGEVDHDLHLPLPEGLQISHLETAFHGRELEVHMTVPAL